MAPKPGAAGHGRILLTVVQVESRTTVETPLALVVAAGESDGDAVASVLLEMGLRSRFHRDAGSALEAVEYDRPALVVHGWDLPDMDAVTFHGAVRQRARGRVVPTLAIAPDAEAASRIPDDGFGLSETLVRPVRESALAERLEGLARRAGIGRPDDPGGARFRPGGESGAAALRWRVLGLGEWGVRAAETFDRQGFPARAIDLPDSIARSSLPEERRHAIVVAGDYATASQELASSPGLVEALRDLGEADLVVVLAGVNAGSGSLVAALVARVAQAAPRAGRCVIARLEGFRSTPDERALGLVVLNDLVQGPPAGIFLIQPHPARSDVPIDPDAPLNRLLEVLSLVGGSHPEAVRAFRPSALGRFFATPGFVGWRETTLTSDDISPESPGWHELVTPAPWQPDGYAWEEAQEVLPLARVPWSWLAAGGRRTFERLVDAAGEEAAPSALAPALIAGEPPFAVLISAGMPFPKGLLALRDSVAADRERLAEKRRNATTTIPLPEDFLPSGFEVITGPAVASSGPSTAPLTPEPPAALEPEISWALDAMSGPDHEPAWSSELESHEGPWTAEPSAPRPAGVLTLETVEAGAGEIELEPLEAGPMPAAYESALELVRRIFSSKDLRAEVDLGEVRYALYDLLEVLREEPQALVPEVFRPELDEYFERHHVNVAVLAILTGDLMRSSLSEVIDLGTAALLHDIGMLPTRETWDVGVKLPPKVFDQAIRPHSETGHRRFQELTGMTGTVARMVLEEHERMDGSGYPQGLAGAAIDPGARVLAACDSLEAMTHPRPYRDHLSPGEALARLRVLGQYTLDPAVVQALTDELQELFRRGAPEAERR